MSVKTTIEYTRDELLDKVQEMKLEDMRENNTIKNMYFSVKDEDLEGLAELLNDRRRGGEGFENYRIVKNPIVFGVNVNVVRQTTLIILECYVFKPAGVHQRIV